MACVTWYHANRTGSGWQISEGSRLESTQVTLEAKRLWTDKSGGPHTTDKKRETCFSNDIENIGWHILLYIQVYVSKRKNADWLMRVSGLSLVMKLFSLMIRWTKSLKEQSSTGPDISSITMQLYNLKNSSKKCSFISHNTTPAHCTHLLY